MIYFFSTSGLGFDAVGGLWFDRAPEPPEMIGTAFAVADDEALGPTYRPAYHWDSYASQWHLVVGRNAGATEIHAEYATDATGLTDLTREVDGTQAPWRSTPAHMFANGTWAIEAPVAAQWLLIDIDGVVEELFRPARWSRLGAPDNQHSHTAPSPPPVG